MEQEEDSDKESDIRPHWMAVQVHLKGHLTHDAKVPVLVRRLSYSRCSLYNVTHSKVIANLSKWLFNFCWVLRSNFVHLNILNIFVFLYFWQIFHAKIQPQRALMIQTKTNLDLFHTVIKGLEKRFPAAGQSSFMVTGYFSSPSTSWILQQKAHAFR